MTVRSTLKMTHKPPRIDYRRDFRDFIDEYMARLGVGHLTVAYEDPDFGSFGYYDVTTESLQVIGVSSLSAWVAAGHDPTNVYGRDFTKQDGRVRFFTSPLPPFTPAYPLTPAIRFTASST